MSTTVLVTPFGVAQQLAAACVLSNIHGTIVPIGEFTGIVLADTDVQAGNEAAAAISKLAGKHEVLLLVRSEEQIDAGHYRHGNRESDVPAGLALKNLPDVLEGLLLETVAAEDVDGNIPTSSMTKLQASAATMPPGTCRGGPHRAAVDRRRGPRRSRRCLRRRIGPRRQHRRLGRRRLRCHRPRILPVADLVGAEQGRKSDDDGRGPRLRRRETSAPLCARPLPPAPR